MGVASVKLEGRMKGPEYVAPVTGIYRRAIDAGRVTWDRWTGWRPFSAARALPTATIGAAQVRPCSASGRRGGEDRALLAQARATYESVENPLVPVEFYMIVESRFRHAGGSGPLWAMCAKP